jgi:D-glycero-D-manno-heptose 1,7-bisphosphate phosphatase
MLPGIFLDRDGVIVENRPDYVRTWSEVVFFPQALAALTKISNSPYKIVIVTNQSVVGRGLITLKVAEEINQKIFTTILQSRGRIDGIYMCPHAPTDKCTCRKPKPGLILSAASDLDIDLNRSLLVGDALTDIQAGKAAGISKTMLVRTGRGEDQLKLDQAQLLKPFFVFNDLKDVVDNLDNLIS